MLQLTVVNKRIAMKTKDCESACARCVSGLYHLQLWYFVKGKEGGVLWNPIVEDTKGSHICRWFLKYQPFFHFFFTVFTPWRTVLMKVFLYTAHFENKKEVDEVIWFMITMRLLILSQVIYWVGKVEEVSLKNHDSHTRFRDFSTISYISNE